MTPFYDDVWIFASALSFISGRGQSLSNFSLFSIQRQLLVWQRCQLSSGVMQQFVFNFIFLKKGPLSWKAPFSDLGWQFTPGISPEQIPSYLLEVEQAPWNIMSPFFWQSMTVKQCSICRNTWWNREPGCCIVSLSFIIILILISTASHLMCWIRGMKEDCCKQSLNTVWHKNPGEHVTLEDQHAATATTHTLNTVKHMMQFHESYPNILPEKVTNRKSALIPDMQN